MLRCNKCNQGEPHLGDSWCLACSAVEALTGELRSAWGAPGSRLLANDICVSAVRQIRALRRLGIAGAGKGRAASPRKGAERGRASSASQRERPASEAVAPEPPQPPPAEAREGERPPSVKAEPAAEASEYEYTEEEDEDDGEPDEDTGLKAAPKAAPNKDDRTELPRRRESERQASAPPADPDRAGHRDRSDKEHRTSRRDRDRRERSRSRRRRGTDRGHEHREHGQRGEGKRKRKHRAGSKHPRLWRANQDPFKRFHHRQPDSFWDRAPLDP
jgi:hypothetical protein